MLPKTKRLLSLPTLSIVLLCAVLTNAEFPTDPQPCKFKDAQCIGQRIKYFFENKFAGDKSINLQEIDPLKVPFILISKGADSPVNIDLQLKNNIITGLKEAKVIKVTGFGSDMTRKHELIFNVKRFRMRGDYTVKGKVIILPVTGSGQHDLNAYNATITMKFNGKPQERNGATYMKIDKMTGSIDAERVTYDFENLFNSDKVLSDNMNAFLNDNWQDIWNELRANLSEGLHPAIRMILDDVFATLPYNDFFAKE